MSEPVIKTLPTMTKPQEVFSEDERQMMILRMSEASSQFYTAAIRIGCHPFIEFTGLMNEYIKICQRAHADGIDFTQCNKHAGHHLPMMPFEVGYINEKLECIFTGRSVVSEKIEP